MSQRQKKTNRHNRFWLELLEDRLAPATFTIANGDTAGLITAINEANATTEADVIELASQGTYLFNQVDNFWFGPTALPAISSDITIDGNGALLRRNLLGPRSASSTSPAD